MATVEKIRKDIEKTKEKISAQQKRLRELEAQLTEEENLEIVRMVKAVRMDNKGSYVLRVEQTQTILGLRNVLSRVDVTVLEQSASGVAVEGPLSPQDVLVKSSARPVAAGDSVRVEQP